MRERLREKLSKHSVILWTEFGLISYIQKEMLFVFICQQQQQKNS